MENMKESQELEFDVYGNVVRGTYVKDDGENCVIIRVTYDDCIADSVGKLQTIHRTFLVTDLPDQNSKGV